MSQILSANVQDALECARNHFSVKAEAAVVFETRELSGCDGQAVEIHETSWQGIRQVLSQIDVRLVNHAQGASCLLS